MEQLKEEILALKKEKNAVILAHYYVADEVQEIADYVGDSFYLSKLAEQASETTLCFCGVSFMGESAKLINPEKMVLLPDTSADCPMAHMADKKQIQILRERYDDLAVVCYINSSAELKQYADVCVTSSNAVAIVKALPNQVIYFIPDQNLGSYVANQVPEKTILLNDGYCPIHMALTKEEVHQAKKIHETAELLVHPECSPEVTELADYVGSTLDIIKYAKASDKKQFLIGTEGGVLFELKRQNPDKEFFMVSERMVCADMKKLTLEKVRDCLKYNTGEVKLPEELAENACKPLKEMLRLA